MLGPSFDIVRSVIASMCAGDKPLVQHSHLVLTYKQIAFSTF